MVPIEKLKQLSFFQWMPEQAIEEFSNSAVEVHFKPGDIIIRQHDEAQFFFFLLSGTVQFLIRFEGVKDLFVGKTDVSGSIIGWSAFRMPYRYNATVRCEKPCHAIRLPREVLDKTFETDPQFGYNFLKRVAATLSDRLKQTLNILVHQNKEDSICKIE